MADGGIGESALMSSVLGGSALGGGISLLAGKNPLQGALLGGLGGGLMGTGGLFGAESGTAGAGLTDLGQYGQIPTSQLGAWSQAMAQQAPSAATAAGDLSGFGSTTPAGLISPAVAGMNPAASTAAGAAASSTTPGVYDLGASGQVPQSAMADWGSAMSQNAPGAASSGLSSIGNWIQEYPKTAAALGLGSYIGYNMLTGKGNNYLPGYNPVTAGSMGLGSTLAAGYRPTRAMATGGSTGTTGTSATSYTPTAWGGVVPSSGVMPADLAASSASSSSPLTMATLQNLANQYGYSLPSTSTGTTNMASGGIAALGANPSAPMAQIQNPSYSVPSQMPTSAQQVRMGSLPPVQMADGGQAQAPAYDPNAELQAQMMMARLSGMPQITPTASAKGGKINGNLGGYSDGGQMLEGPGDGMSDNIPASISGKQPARLADGEFVVPADVVSHLGNGSTDAGAKQLYSMMDRVRTARTGRKAQGKQINAQKQLPA